MVMVRINKDYLQFITLGQLADKSSVVWNVQANHRGQIRNQLRNFETDRTRFVNLQANIDGVDPGAAVVPVPPAKRSCDDRRRKPAQCSDFDHAPRRQNADQRRQKTIITAADRSEMVYRPMQHGMEKFDFTSGRDFSIASQQRTEMRIISAIVVRRLEF